MKTKDTLTERALVPKTWQVYLRTNAMRWSVEVEAEVKAEAERIAEDCCNRTHPSMAGFRVLRSKTRRVTP